MEIDESSDLYNTLVDALGKFGDPYQPFRVQQRETLVIAGSANVRVDPDYLWEKVAPSIRAKLLDVFSYDRRDFAQVLSPSARSKLPNRHGKTLRKPGFAERH